MSNVVRLPHVQRMIDERDEVAVRADRLATFLEGDLPTELAESEEDVALLEIQLSAMRTYLEVLQLRINRAHK